jgi:biopolymer transport protein ExbD/biopolymer transport protein TolR
MVISIDKSQRVYLGDQPVNVNDIPGILKARVRDPQNQAIYLRADENVPFGAFAAVMDSVKQANITNVSIVTQPYNESNGRIR